MTCLFTRSTSLQPIFVAKKRIAMADIYIQGLFIIVTIPAITTKADRVMLNGERLNFVGKQCTIAVTIFISATSVAMLSNGDLQSISLCSISVGKNRKVSLVTVAVMMKAIIARSGVTTSSIEHISRFESRIRSDRSRSLVEQSAHENTSLFTQGFFGSLRQRRS